MASLDLERELIVQIQGGNRQAHDLWVQRDSETIAAAARHALGHTREKPCDEDLVADATQEACIRVWTHRDTLDPSKAPLVNLAIVMAMNWLRDHFRAAGQRLKEALPGLNLTEDDASLDEIGRVVNPPADVHTPTALEIACWSEEMEILHQVAEELSPEQRRLIDLRFWESLTYGDIGQLLGVTEARAKTMVENAVDRLLTLMRARNIDWDGVSPLPRMQLPRPKIKGITKKEGPDGEPRRRADGPVRAGADGDPQSPGAGEAGDEAEGSEDEGDLG